MNIAMSFLLRFANLLAGISLCVAGLVVVIQLVAIPSEYFIPHGSEPLCTSYEKPKFKPYRCSDSLLPAISVDYTPTAISLIVGLVAFAWLAFGPRQQPLTDLLFASLFILVLPVFGRVSEVIAGSAKPAFLFGAIPPLALILGVIIVLIRSGGPAFAKSTESFPNWPKRKTAQFPVSQSIAESVEQVEKSVESLKKALNDTPSHGSKAAKIHAEKVVSIGESFLERQRPPSPAVYGSSKFSLQARFKGFVDFLKALVLVLFVYAIFKLLLALISFFQRTS